VIFFILSLGRKKRTNQRLQQTINRYSIADNKNYL
jgi:hypothetical protein